MSTLWTPGGERPIRRDPESAPPAASGPGPDDQGPPLSPEEMEAQMAQLQDQLARTPAAVVVANHAFGLFELAALHLSLEQPQLEEARLAIDALGALVEGLGDRLGQHAKELQTGLSQLRIAFVQIHAAHPSGGAAETGQATPG